MKFTLRHLFVLVFFSALMLASMRVGGAIAKLTLIFAGTLIALQSIVALVAKRERRAFAVGFLVALFAYVLPHGAIGSIDPYNDKALPTTRAFQPIHRGLCSRTWIDYESKAVVSDDDPRVVEAKKKGATALATPKGMVALRETPSPVKFALLAHTAIALALGAVGGGYALRVYRDEESG